MLPFDGMLESHYAYAFDRMSSTGYAGVEAVMSEAVGDGERLTIDKLEGPSDAGWNVTARPRTGAHFLHEYPSRSTRG